MRMSFGPSMVMRAEVPFASMMRVMRFHSRKSSRPSGSVRRALPFRQKMLHTESELFLRRKFVHVSGVGITEEVTAPVRRRRELIRVVRDKLGDAVDEILDGITACYQIVVLGNLPF